MKAEKVYLIGIHPNSFRVGVPAEIIGMSMVTPDSDKDPRLCYKIRFSDDYIDYSPVSDIKTYEIVTFDEIPKPINQSKEKIMTINKYADFIKFCQQVEKDGGKFQCLSGDNDWADKNLDRSPNLMMYSYFKDNRLRPMPKEEVVYFTCSDITPSMVFRLADVDMIGFYRPTYTGPEGVTFAFTTESGNIDISYCDLHSMYVYSDDDATTWHKCRKKA